MCAFLKIWKHNWQIKISHRKNLKLNYQSFSYFFLTRNLYFLLIFTFITNSIFLYEHARLKMILKVFSLRIFGERICIQPRMNRGFNQSINQWRIKHKYEVRWVIKQNKIIMLFKKKGRGGGGKMQSHHFFNNT